jgi:hypothetical protein
VSDPLVERILKTPMESMSDKALLALMGTFANADGTRCFPGVTRLARESGLKERAVQLGLRRLEKAGRIEPTARARQHKTTEYRIVVELLAVVPRGARTYTSGGAGRGAFTYTSEGTPEVQVRASRGAGSCAAGVHVHTPDSKTLTLEADSEAKSKATPTPRGADAPPVRVNHSGWVRVWTLYPKKVGKIAAAREWDKIAPTPDVVEDTLAALEAQKQSDQWRRGYIPDPERWLKHRRWTDEIPPAPAPVPDTKITLINPKDVERFQRGTVDPAVLSGGKYVATVQPKHGELSRSTRERWKQR